MRDVTPRGTARLGQVHDGTLRTVAEAARMLGVSPSTIWRWIDAGRLPAYRLGPRSIRIKQQDVEAAVKPARPKPDLTEQKDGSANEPPTRGEIARRKSLVTAILELRRKAVIAPLTTADLVHQARAQEYEAYGRPG